MLYVAGSRSGGPVGRRLGQAGSAAGLVLLGLAACEGPGSVTIPPNAATVTAAAETTPVESRDDAADDPAVWVAPDDPAASRILGTDKEAGLGVYALDGRLLQFLPVGNVNNVDLRQNVALGGARRDVAAASNRSDGTITVFAIDARGEVGVIGAFASGWVEPYGLCMARGPRETPVVFANEQTGAVRKWALALDGRELTATLLGELRLASQPEGCVFDEDAGVLYVGEEARGLWRVEWSGDAPGAMRLVDEAGSGTGLTADVEGVALYREPGGGYLIVSSQGSHSYIVYERAGDNRFVGELAIVDDPVSGVDGAAETDGIEAVSANLGAAFPQGVLIAQDGFNAPERRQNFKIVDWRVVARALTQEPEPNAGASR